MVMSCSALGCRNRFTKKSKQTNGIQLTFHKFPSDNPMFPEKVALRQLWHTAVKRPNWTAPKRAVLCSEHFLATDFYRFGSVTKLRENVVPSIFKPVSDSPEKKPRRSAPKKARKEHNIPQTMENITATVVTTTDAPPEDQELDPGCSLDLSAYGATGTSIVNQALGITQALARSNFAVLANCTIKQGEFSLDPTAQNVIRTVTLNSNAATTDLLGTNQNYTYYSTTVPPVTSTITTYTEPMPIKTETRYPTSPSPTATTSVVKSPTSMNKDLSMPSTSAVLMEDLRRYKAKLDESKKKIKTLTEKVRRQDARLKSYDSHVNEMKYEAQDAAEILSKNLHEGPKQLLKRIALKSDIMTNEENAYHEDLRAYAMTLHSISPRAYDFVRESFNKTLPSTSRIRQWKHEGTVVPLPLPPVQSELSSPTSVLAPSPSMFTLEPRSAVQNLLGEL